MVISNFFYPHSAFRKLNPRNFSGFFKKPRNYDSDSEDDIVELKNANI